MSSVGRGHIAGRGESVGQAEAAVESPEEEGEWVPVTLAEVGVVDRLRTCAGPFSRARVVVEYWILEAERYGY